jgi:hypothetical protein
MIRILSYLIGACLSILAFLATPVAAQDAYWKGMAAGLDTIYVARPFTDRESVEESLKQSCILGEEDDDCHSIRVTPISDYLIGIYCSNGYDDVQYVGSSREGIDHAFRMLLHPEGEASWFGPEMCRVVAISPPIDVPSYW